MLPTTPACILRLSSKAATEFCQRCCAVATSVLIEADVGAAPYVDRVCGLNLLDVERDVLRLGEQRLSSRDRRLKLGQRRHRQVGEVLRLVDQALGLVGQALNLVVDLLKLARRREHVLREVVGIENDPLRGDRCRRQGRDRQCQRNRCGSCGMHAARLVGDHDCLSRFGRLGMRSAAQARPRSASQAAVKASRPCSASTRSIAA